MSDEHPKAPDLPPEKRSHEDDVVSTTGESRPEGATVQSRDLGVDASKTQAAGSEEDPQATVEADKSPELIGNISRGEPAAPAIIKREASGEPASFSSGKRVGPSGEEIRSVTASERRGMSRRQLLTMLPVLALGAFAIPKFRQPLLDEGVRFSDWASGKLFGEHRLVPTFSDSQVASFEKFPYNYYDVADPEVDLERWTLTVEGLVQYPGDYKLEQIRALPKLVQNTRHVCVEGWDVIGNFGGVRASDFLNKIGADTSARFLEVQCVDGYYESIDMATMLHPQTLFCYEMYGKPLDRGHGAPLRLQMPTKLGYKQAKYLDTIRVTNVLSADKRGYWEDQGYSWYGGL